VIRESESAPFTVAKVQEFLERLASARSVTDVNIAAGIALNQLLDIDD
jgi:hypothetical protein